MATQANEVQVGGIILTLVAHSAGYEQVNVLIRFYRESRKAHFPNKISG